VPLVRTVIFDLDGTLADTSGDLIAAANACFEALGQGRVLDPARDQAAAFAGARAMLRLGFERLGQDVGQVEQQFPLAVAHYGANIDVYTTLYPGAIAAVETLLRDGYRVGICTNKPAGLADILLRKLGVRDLFMSLIGADTLPVRKPDAAPYVAAVTGAGGAVERSLIIGDTITDFETAKAAGVPSVLVGFGPGRKHVLALKPDALLDNYADLSDIVRRLIG